MLRKRPERALRRAVAGLARLHPDDVEAILAALDSSQRAQVDALIAGLGAAPAAAPEPAGEEPEWAYDSVSPWLLARIDPDDRKARRAARDFVLMTDAAREALVAAAAPFRKQVERGGNGRTLLDQAWRLLRGARG